MKNFIHKIEYRVKPGGVKATWAYRSASHKVAYEDAQDLLDDLKERNNKPIVYLDEKRIRPKK